jgi:hypothetical protein
MGIVDRRGACENPLHQQQEIRSSMLRSILPMGVS